MNKKFVIVSDSCCELTEDLRQKYDVEYIPMYISYDGKEIYADIDWKELSVSEFYDILRANTRIFTSQIPAFNYQERFEEYLKQGYDILSISCSSGLSASVKASMVACGELKENYPESKIICVDSLNCGKGLGLLCIYASRLRAEEKTIEETAQAIEDIKMNVNQLGTVDELKYLKRAGRISASKALFGTMLSVKPIIVSNTNGENVSIDKAKGRNNSMRRLAQMTKELYTGKEISDIFVSHADCLEDAEKVKAYILELIPTANVVVSELNPIMGASCGPKTIAIYFVGAEKPNTINA